MKALYFFALTYFQKEGKRKKAKDGKELFFRGHPILIG